MAESSEGRGRLARADAESEGSKARAYAALRVGLLGSLSLDRAARVDSSGRTYAFEDNLVTTLSDAQILALRRQLAAGDGGELSESPEGLRPDANAAHSSSALAFNVFGAWLGSETQLVINGVTGFTEPLRVEARQPIFRGGRAPNLDCLLKGQRSSWAWSPSSPSRLLDIDRPLGAPPMPARHVAGCSRTFAGHRPHILSSRGHESR
jgi:hypothetical protein